MFYIKRLTVDTLRGYTVTMQLHSLWMSLCVTHTRVVTIFTKALLQPKYRIKKERKYLIFLKNIEDEKCRNVRKVYNFSDWLIRN